jgi:signal transduction histidine kinase
MLLDVIGEQRAGGLHVEVEIPKTPPLPFEAARALCGACREALTNVAKHSGQARASVQIRVHGARIVVEVRDNGVGFDTTATAGGFGTVNSIRQRMADAGGRAEIVAAPGRGTAVIASWPA